MKNKSKTRFTMYFEPQNPILTKEDFTDELIQYCHAKKKDLTILKESMEPIVEIDGQRYLCLLEQPRYLNFPFSIFFYARSMGYKFVYLYKYQP